MLNKQINYFFFVAALFFIFSSTNMLYAQTPQTNLETMNLSAGLYRLNVQVASTFEERQTGLMWHQSMPQNQGMLFIFERPSVQCFWMKNTSIPLSAAFLHDDGTIVNILDMPPFSTDSYCSTQPVRFVLEVNQGWFEKHGITAGNRISGEAFK